MKTATDDPFRLEYTGRIAQALYRALARIPGLPFCGPFNLTTSDEKKFIWFRVAKVGTRTILNHLQNSGVKLAVERAASIYYCPHLYPGYFKFAFVRNPWDRLVSCWNDKVVNLNHFQFSDADLEKMRRFENFVEFVAGLDLGTCDRHLQLQSRLIDLAHVDYVGRMETFEADLRRVCARLKIPHDRIIARNTSGKSPYQQYYTPALREKVAELYAPDIQIFGYQFEP